MGENNFLAELVDFLTSKSGFMVCIALPALLISGLILRNAMKTMKGDMSKLVAELTRDETQKTKSAGTVASSKPQQTNHGITAEEYQEMYERIKAELIEELKEELKQLEKREQSNKS